MGKKYTRCRRLVPDITVQVSHQYGGAASYTFPWHNVHVMHRLITYPRLSYWTQQPLAEFICMNLRPVPHNLPENKQKMHYVTPNLGTVLRQINSVHDFTSYFLKSISIFVMHSHLAHFLKLIVLVLCGQGVKVIIFSICSPNFLWGPNIFLRSLCSKSRHLIYFFRPKFLEHFIQFLIYSYGY